MRITFDPKKRDWTLRERGLDFAEAEEVFAGATIDIPDLRQITANCASKAWGSCEGDRGVDRAR